MSRLRNSKTTIIKKIKFNFVKSELSDDLFNISPIELTV